MDIEKLASNLNTALRAFRDAKDELDECFAEDGDRQYAMEAALAHLDRGFALLNGERQ